MSLPQPTLARDFDLARARAAILRCQPASNWVTASRDPTPRMTIGFGFDVSRPEASEMLEQVGADPAAVRAGRAPISDAQMHELFDLTLLAAVGWAHRRLPGFAGMSPEQQRTLLELIVWLGPDGSDAIVSELKGLSLPFTREPLEPSPWFDVPRSTNGSQHAELSITGCRTTFESFGFVAEVMSDDADLLADALAMLPPGWRPIDGQPNARFGLWTSGSITVDGAQAALAADRASLLLRLGAIVRHRLATEALGFTFVHAGVVDVGGCGIVIPGRSYTGKSTLVAELVRLGAKYLSDEYAVLDPNGLVQPFAKPLSIRAGRHDRLGQLVPVPATQVAEAPVETGLIVLTSYAPGARWRPSARSRAEGAFALLQNTVSARLRPGSALSATSGFARGAVVLAGQRGEAAETAPVLLEAALLHAGRSNRFPA
jgi:hypothetical protein